MSVKILLSNTLVWNIRKNNQDLTEKKTLNSETAKQLINDFIQKHGIKSIDADYLLEKIEKWDAQNPGIISNRGLTTELLWFLAGKDAKFEPIDYQPQELPEFK